MDSEEVRQALLDAIGKAAPVAAGTGHYSGQALHHLAEAWKLLQETPPPS